MCENVHNLYAVLLAHFQRTSRCRQYAYVLQFCSNVCFGSFSPLPQYISSRADCSHYASPHSKSSACISLAPGSSFLDLFAASISSPSYFASLKLRLPRRVRDCTMPTTNTNDDLSHVGGWATNGSYTTKSPEFPYNATLHPHPNIGAISTQDSASILAAYHPTVPAPAVHAVQQDSQSHHTGADTSSVRVQPSWSTKSE
jgi:hypothetical protein